MSVSIPLKEKTKEKEMVHHLLSNRKERSELTLGPGCSSLHTPHSSGLHTYHHSPETNGDTTHVNEGPKLNFRPRVKAKLE